MLYPFRLYNKIKQTSDYRKTKKNKNGVGITIKSKETRVTK